MVNLSIYSTRSHQVRLITILGILIKLRLIIAEQIFLKTFFPYTIIEWNKLDLDVRKSKSYATFRNTLLKLGRPIQHAIYSINNPVGLKLLTLLLFGNQKYTEIDNSHIVNASIKYLLDSGRFSGPLL